MFVRKMIDGWTFGSRDLSSHQSPIIKNLYYCYIIVICGSSTMKIIIDTMLTHAFMGKIFLFCFIYNFSE